MDLENTSSSESELDMNDFEVRKEDTIPVSQIQFKPNKYYDSPDDDFSDDNEEDACQKHVQKLRAMVSGTCNEQSSPKKIFLNDLSPNLQDFLEPLSFMSNDIHFLIDTLGSLVLSQFTKHVYGQSAGTLEYCSKAKLKPLFKDNIRNEMNVGKRMKKFLSELDETAQNHKQATKKKIGKRMKKFLSELDETYQNHKQTTKKKIEQIKSRMSIKPINQSQNIEKPTKQRKELELLNKCTELRKEFPLPSEPEAFVTLENEVAMELACLTNYLHECAATTKSIYDSDATESEDDIECPQEFDFDESLAKASYARIRGDLCDEVLFFAESFYGRLNFKENPDNPGSCARCVPLAGRIQLDPSFINADRLDLVLPSRLQPTSLKCECQPPQLCFLCTGRKDPTRPRSVNTQNNHMALLDTGYHPTLTSSSVQNFDIALEGCASDSKWQRKFKRLNPRTTLRKILKMSQAEGNPGEPRVKRKYVKKNDRIQTELAVTVQLADTLITTSPPIEWYDKENSQTMPGSTRNDDLVVDTTFEDLNLNIDLLTDDEFLDTLNFEIGAYEDILSQDRDSDDEIDIMN